MIICQIADPGWIDRGYMLKYLLAWDKMLILDYSNFEQMKNLILLFAVALLVITGSCKSKSTADKLLALKADSVLVQAKRVFKPLPDEAINPDNPLTPEKIALGKMLYYDNRLSANNTQSCNTCHNLDTYGVDNKATSPGDNGVPGTRNSPTTLNAALHFAQFWDGRMKDVEEQAGGPVVNPAEMNMPSEELVITRLAGDVGYKKMFASAFPGLKEPITFENMRKAIGAFERTLLTPSQFDNFLKGDRTALTLQELNGVEIFINTGCTACHIGPLKGGSMFQKYPLFGTHQELTGSKTDDLGKMQATKIETDKYLFKVPSLRNVVETWPYLHDGSVKELDRTVLIMGRAELNKQLSTEQTAGIVAFLKTLTGEVPESAKLAVHD